MNSITLPFRLAVGSHTAGSGKGCAMNVISWENGDAIITSYPACAAQPLTRMVQKVNDTICTHRASHSRYEKDLLCAPCSVKVLELAHLTPGTAGATRERQNAWLAELLHSPWGLTSLVRDEKILMILRETAAAILSGNKGRINTAYAAYAAYAYAYAANAAAYADVAAAHAADAADAASYEITRSAILAWHRICGTSPSAPDPAVTGAAVARMLETSGKAC